MKYIFGILIIFGFSLVAASQSKGSAKLYAYKQAVLPGVPRGATSQNGEEEAPPRRAAYNYWIYLVTPSRVYPSEMWINGQPYSVRAETVTTPVQQGSSAGSPQGKELVPKTTGKVVLLTPAPATEGKRQARSKTLASTHELVVVYKQNGKFYYNTVGKLTELEAAAMQ